MPPRAKFTKEEIIEAALGIVREKGISELTARALGTALGSSSCPIFTVFTNMDEVQENVIEAAKKVYKSYMDKGIPQTPAFRGVGEQYVLFAVEQPNLFKLLFMSEKENKPAFTGVLPLLDESYDTILLSISEAYDLTKEQAAHVYRHLWVYTHGIATLCVTKICRFTAEQIDEMITEVFLSLLKNMKGENVDD